MVRPIEYHLPYEEVKVYARCEVLVAVDDNILLITGDPQGILDQQLRPRLIKNYYFIFCWPTDKL